MKILSITLLTMCCSLAYAANESVTTELKFTHGDDVVSVLESLIDESVSVSVKDNILIINGEPDKVKKLVEIVKQIDTPPAPLTIEFIASNHKIDFGQKDKVYQSSKSSNNVSQSMSITERQWVTLNTGLSIPIAERTKYADGTETQSFRYEKISKSYIFKVHEFSGWSVIQVGMNASSLDSTIAGAIQNTHLDTTIVGKTGEWLEVASTKKVFQDENTREFTTRPKEKNYIHLYVKVITNNDTGQIIESK